MLESESGSWSCLQFVAQMETFGLLVCREGVRIGVSQDTEKLTVHFTHLASQDLPPRSGLSLLVPRMSPADDTWAESLSTTWDCPAQANGVGVDRHFLIIIEVPTY